MKYLLKNVLWFAVLCVLCLATPYCVFGQGLARISGTVTDSSGAAIPNATVVATRLSTGDKTTVTSNGAGEFVFPSLAPAEYSIGVTETGFTGFLQKSVVLQADQSITVNAALTVGSDAQVINVDSAPPQVDTTTGTLSQVIDEKRVNDLPLN
ncbi:MAG TPA: carboxypeptidase-like regulatory domain-containing protein, partial [Edaphobacter sp.]|uniref:carboxypeptidase-like regulatory domain-containing protein n=1 Tax=Edaphobacter sp. TaxID=1934404 RepID=UPI002BBF34AC